MGARKGMVRATKQRLRVDYGTTLHRVSRTRYVQTTLSLPSNPKARSVLERWLARSHDVV
jgi:hypothetical protein